MKLPQHRAGRIEPTARAIYRSLYVFLWTVAMVCMAEWIDGDGDVAYAVAAAWSIAAGLVVFYYLYRGEL